MTAALLLAQNFGGYSIAQLAIWAIIVCGIIAIVFAFIKYSGVQVPQIAITVFWIIVAVVVCVFGIKLLMSVV